MVRNVAAARRRRDIPMSEMVKEINKIFPDLLEDPQPEDELDPVARSKQQAEMRARMRMGLMRNAHDSTRRP